MVKFLIIRFSSIGDIILTTPIIRCLKKQVEDAEIHYLVRPGFKEILTANPYISKIHLLSNNQNETVAELNNENFDYVLDLQNNIRSANIKRALKRMYFTVDKLNLKKWLFVNFKINLLPDLHIVDRYMATTKLFDVKNDTQGLDYFIIEEEKVSLSEFPADYQDGYIVLVMGAKHQTKKMPLEKLVDIAANLNFPLILIGGKVDKGDGDLLISKLVNKPIINACGKWSLSGSASIIEQSRCVITHDTGMMHVAAAFGKKIITIWGNTVPDFGMYAYHPDINSMDFEVHGLKCRPCSKLGKSSCPKKHFNCMMQQDITKISAHANSLFES